MVFHDDFLSPRLRKALVGVRPLQIGIMADIEVRRFAIKYNPPTLCVEYKIDGERTVLRKISLKKYRNKSPDLVADRLLRKCEDILGPEHARRVSEEQVRDLVTLLLTPHDEDVGDGDVQDFEESGDGEESFGDLNAVSEEENARAKASMSAGFEKNRLRPGELGYQYDKRADFVPSEPADWDED